MSVGSADYMHHCGMRYGRVRAVWVMRQTAFHRAFCAVVAWRSDFGSVGGHGVQGCGKAETDSGDGAS
jgi:hypothetical protein